MEFLKNNNRFSFVYGEKRAFERAFSKSVKESGNELITVYDFEKGLRVTNRAKKYADFDAYEWVNELENTGNAETELISELWDSDVDLPFPHEEKRAPSAYCPGRGEVTEVRSPLGANVGERDFAAEVDEINFNMPDYLFPGKSMRFRNISGRSSDGRAPFWNVSFRGTGFIAAVGWTGQWNCRIERLQDSVNFRSKVEDTCFCLYPGEKIRTSSVVIMTYEGDVESGQNKWRRFLRAHFSPVASYEDVPFSLGVWGGMPTREVLARIDAAEESGIPTDHLWMDAGWYGGDTLPTPNEFEGDWAEHTGDFRVSPYVHPQGMRDIAERLRKSGKKFLLWLEPERVRASAPIVREHPEYFISSGREGETNLLLNLGNSKAREYCYLMLYELIESLDIRCYRQDFNFYPLSVWRNADGEKRQGITEIKHVMGLYRLWDALRERFPKLLIDNCASGGKRIDIETLRRSLPLWRSDVYCPANYKSEAAQVHNMSFALWMPYSGTGSGRAYDEYALRSAYAPGLRLCHAFSAAEAFEVGEGTALLKKYGEEYLAVRRYFAGDVHFLTKPTADESAWCAVQWSLPESGEGMVQVFTREKSVYTEGAFKLYGISAGRRYRFRDLDGGEFTVSGRELVAHGLRLRTAEKRKAKIFIYNEI
ncbi:MAG: alpha-galactosidase [Clostridia bacterium]|nr:alpha-galactosidase [Clostridia bacterium]